MNPNQKKLLAFIKVKGCLLDPDEIIDFYVVNVQRRVCRIGILESPKDAKEYDWAILRDQARSFYLNALGRLVVEGLLQVKILR